MKRLLIPAVALSLLAGCATNEPRNDEPQYQIGVTGNRQSRIEAERTHAGGSTEAGRSADHDSAPRLLSSHFPEYPRKLRAAGIEGRVVVRFIVEPDGSVSDPAVQGSPPPELAALTLDAIRKWKFAPATKNGRPIRARIQQPFLFQME